MRTIKLSCLRPLVFLIHSLPLYFLPQTLLSPLAYSPLSRKTLTLWFFLTLSNGRASPFSLTLSVAFFLFLTKALPAPFFSSYPPFFLSRKSPVFLASFSPPASEHPQNISNGLLKPPSCSYQRRPSLQLAKRSAAFADSSTPCPLLTGS